MKSRNLNLTTAVLFLYCLLLSWNSIFRLEQFTVPMIISLIILAIVGWNIIQCAGRLSLSTTQAQALFPSPDLFLLLLFFTMILNSLPYLHNATTGRLALFLIVVLGYFSFKFAWVFSRLRAETLLWFIVVGVLVASCYVFLEFTLRNFAAFDIQLFLPRNRQATAALGGVIYRAYGFSTEPTIVAFYLNTFAALSIYAILNSRTPGFLKAIFISLILMAFAFTLSPTIFLLIGSSLFWLLILNASKKIYIKNLKLFFSLSVAIVVVALLLSAFLDLGYILNSFTNQVTLTTQGARTERWNAAIDDWLQYAVIPFGLGEGYFSSVWGTSPVNYYLMLLVESGILGVLFFLLFFLGHGLLILRSSQKYRTPILIGLSAGLIHLSTNSMYWNPFLWVLVAFAAAVRAEEAK